MLDPELNLTLDHYDYSDYGLVFDLGPDRENCLKEEADWVAENQDHVGAVCPPYWDRNSIINYLKCH